MPEQFGLTVSRAPAGFSCANDGSTGSIQLQKENSMAHAGGLVVPG
jgi:hypothetical protein